MLQLVALGILLALCQCVDARELLKAGACAEKPCGDGGTCKIASKTAAGYRCKCSSDYELYRSPAGPTCILKGSTGSELPTPVPATPSVANPCNVKPGPCGDSPSTVCTNTPGKGAGYSCACAAGFKDYNDKYKSCTDIDECSLPTQPCGRSLNVRCIDNPIPAQPPICSCIFGYGYFDPEILDCYELSGCEPGIDFCGAGTYCYPSQFVGGDPTCECAEGYDSYDPVSKSCQVVARCNNNYCGNDDPTSGVGCLEPAIVGDPAICYCLPGWIPYTFNATTKACTVCGPNNPKCYYDSSVYPGRR